MSIRSCRTLVDICMELLLKWVGRGGFSSFQSRSHLFLLFAMGLTIWLLPIYGSGMVWNVRKYFSLFLSKIILQAADSQNITVSVRFLSESKLNGLCTERKETVRSCLFVCFFVLPCKEINRGAFGRFPFNKNSSLKLRKFQVPNEMVHSGCTDPT